MHRATNTSGGSPVSRDALIRALMVLMVAIVVRGVGQIRSIRKCHPEKTTGKVTESSAYLFRRYSQ